MYVPGCHVRLLQSESALDSILDSEKCDAVGLAYTLLCVENVEAVDDCKGVMYGGGACPGGPEKGLPVDDIDKRRPGGGGPAQDIGLDEDIGDCIADPKRAGLPVAVENVAEVGVVGALDCAS